ncbi:MAG: hypothetical protein AB7L76_16855 [Burkholderiaceae bacterium]
MTSLILASRFLSSSRLLAYFRSLLPEPALRQLLFIAAVRTAVPIGFVLILLLIGAPDGAAPLLAAAPAAP